MALMGTPLDPARTDHRPRRDRASLHPVRRDPIVDVARARGSGRACRPDGRDGDRGKHSHKDEQNAPSHVMFPFPLVMRTMKSHGLAPYRTDLDRSAKRDLLHGCGALNLAVRLCHRVEVECLIENRLVHAGFACDLAQ